MAYGALGAASNTGLALALAVPAQAETVIAALGDSLTQGYGLPQAEGFVPTLQTWLAEHGYEAEVQNAGVSGDTSAGGLSRLDWTLSGDVDALIVALGGNDVLRGIDPAETRTNLDAIIGRAKERGLPVLLIGMTAPGNYGPDYKRAFEAIFPDLADKHGTLLVESFFRRLQQGDRAAARARYMQPDGIHPNAEGVELIVKDVGPAVGRLIGRARDP